jgi:cytidylate kinase
MVRQLDEKSPGLMHEAILRLLRMPESAPFGLEEYHESLMKTLAMLAARGDAIMVGRGANFVLRWSTGGLHIRITGSFDVRLHRECERLRWPIEKVRADLGARDADRRQFIHHHFKRDFDDLRNYDISFNTDALSAEQVADAIASMVRPSIPPEQKAVS